MKRILTTILFSALLTGFVPASGGFRYVSGGRLAVDERYDRDIDRALQRRLHSRYVQMEGQMNQVIGRCARRLKAEDPEGALNNFCADLLLRQTREIIGFEADLALINNHALRKDLPQGEITVGMVYEVLPFDDELVVLELQGKDLQRLVQTVARRGSETFADLRLTERDKHLVDFTVGGLALDPQRTYRLVTIDYLAEGSGGMSVLRSALSMTKTGYFLRDCMIREFEMATREGREVTSRIDGRFKSIEP